MVAPTSLRPTQERWSSGRKSNTVCGSVYDKHHYINRQQFIDYDYSNFNQYYFQPQSTSGEVRAQQLSAHRLVVRAI